MIFRFLRLLPVLNFAYFRINQLALFLSFLCLLYYFFFIAMQLSIYLSATFLLDRVGKRVFLRVTSAKPTITPRNLRCLVGSSGLEPPTSRLSGVRSNHLSYEPISLVPRRLVPRPLFPLLPLAFASSAALTLRFALTSARIASSAAGGDEQIRTVDPLLARQVLSQLSYTPISYRFASLG